MPSDLVDRYAAGGAQLAASIAGLNRDDLNATPVAGTWSIQQIVLHMMDSDLIGSDRMKRVAAEDKPPTLIGYDETAFARELFYDQLDTTAACEIFAANRRMTAEILKRLPETAYARTGYHNEHGNMTLGELLKTYVEHLDHHLRFIKQKRELLGK